VSDYRIGCRKADVGYGRLRVRERSFGRGNQGVDPRSARCARSERLGEVRIGRIGFAEAVGVADSRLHCDVCVRESRSSGAIRSEKAAAEVEKSDHVGYASWSAVG
jgi:hypothetical protein